MLTSIITKITVWTGCLLWRQTLIVMTPGMSPSFTEGAPAATATWMEKKKMKRVSQINES